VTDADGPADLPKLDTKRLIALLVMGDQVVIDEAYQRVFNTELGRVVLAHHMMECGVGNPITAETDSALREVVARHNAALELAAKAGIGQAAIVAATITGTLEENDDELRTPAYISDDASDEFDDRD
jgi:hypothetical protein